MEAADGNCNPLCNTSVCLWDMGDCGEISQADIGAADTAHFGSLEKLVAIVSGVSAAEARRAGVLFGVMTTVGACCLFCCLRHYKKKLIKKPARAYAAYGETDAPVDALEPMAENGGGTEMNANRMCGGA